ncbi:hypothetical protein Tco_1065135 [Tanacetum coccineum]
MNTRTNDNSVVGPNSVENQLASMMRVITRLTESVTSLENRINHGEGTSKRRENLGGQNCQTGNHYGRLIKVDDDGQKIRLVSMHVFDKALNCHKKFMKKFGEIVTWEVYETQVIKRFESVFKDPVVELKNLKHTTNVQIYQDSFEALLNKVKLSESYAVSLFIGGLKEEIAYDVRMFKPTTLIDIFYLLDLIILNQTRMLSVVFVIISLGM